jgi:imidazole glycerol-phosphate synthase subunit HisH
LAHVKFDGFDSFKYIIDETNSARMTGGNTDTKIAVIDYGCGNVGSVKNMFSKIDIWSEIIASPELLYGYNAIVLPGVGSFDNGVQRLRTTGFWDVIVDMVENKKIPILGICLGMQLFFEASEEGEEKGFGWIPGILQKFDKEQDRVPHIGWNTLQEMNNPELFEPTKNEFYFVHSYHAPRDLAEEYCLAKCDYTGHFPAAVVHENSVGFQFHPEKSLSNGMELLKNWYAQFVVK